MKTVLIAAILVVSAQMVWLQPAFAQALKQKNLPELENDLKKINEDSVLIYHNNAYIKGFAYRTLDDVKDAFKNSDNKIEWIKYYIEELHTTFSNVKKF